MSSVQQMFPPRLLFSSARLDLEQDDKGWKNAGTNKMSKLDVAIIIQMISGYIFHPFHPLDQLIDHCHKERGAGGGK